MSNLIFLASVHAVMTNITCFLLKFVSVTQTTPVGQERLTNPIERLCEKLKREPTYIVKSVRLVRGACRIMRAAHFYIRRTLSSSILLHDVHTELVYIMSGLKTALKKIIL